MTLQSYIQQLPLEMQNQAIQEQRDVEEIMDYIQFHNGSEQTITDPSTIDNLTMQLKQVYTNTQAYNTKQSVTIRLNTYDIMQIKKHAFKKNMPYQTLIGAKLHEFAYSLR
jgi:predicted DNA binding CopG/RHH family protein